MPPAVREETLPCARQVAAASDHAWGGLRRETETGVQLFRGIKDALTRQKQNARREIKDFNLAPLAEKCPKN